MQTHKKLQKQMGKHVSLQKVVYAQAQVCSGLMSTAGRTAWYTLTFDLEIFNKRLLQHIILLRCARENMQCFVLQAHDMQSWITHLASSAAVNC